MRFSNILLVLGNHSHRVSAFRRAAEFARNAGADLTVCEVVAWADSDYSGYLTEATSRKLLDKIVAERTMRLQQMIDSCDIGDLRTAAKVLVGKPRFEIAHSVRANHYDLVIKTFESRRGIRHLADRRDDRDLVRNCPCPVWLLNAAEPERGGCILAALDMPAGRAEGNELNRHILEMSRAIAVAEGRPLHIVHAWRLPEKGGLRARGVPATEMQFDRMIVREVAKRSRWLRNTVDTVMGDSRRNGNDGVVPELHLLKGHAKNIIPDFAEELGAEVVVVGTEGRTGVSGVVYGNTSEKIMPRSDRSLLIVKRPERMPAAVVPLHETQRTSCAPSMDWPGAEDTARPSRKKSVEVHTT